MTYVSRKEKVFDLPEHDEDSSTSVNCSETRLKRFPSVSDRRAWTSEDNQRYQHLYGLVNGSGSNISKSASFKYIPFDVLLAILMAEKDAIIQELLERQGENRSCGGKANVLYKSEGFEDSDDDRDALIRKDAEMVSLKNKIAGLESELEDYRDTLTKAMHKLESMDSILSENNLLKEKIKFSEETIKYLEERKAQLEKELGFRKQNYESPRGLDGKQKGVEKVHEWNAGDSEQLVCLSSERDLLVSRVEELQRELEVARSNAAEVEVLRKISETTSSSLDEMFRENECYKKKLESMKFLEKHIEELKKQAHSLTDKYKRESQKANDQLKQINVNNKELQLLREERDKLQVRVTELLAYETQYMALKSRLHQVDLIIDENDILNKKLIQLDRLELENEQLKIRLEQMKCAELEAVEDKEKVMQLQCAVTSQEEEIKRMVRHIEELTQGYEDKNQLHLLRNELDEKNIKLKKYEKQLDDIPVLESEIDLLKNKLQKCIDDFKADKDLLRRLQEELEACRKRCHELEEMAPLCQEEPSLGTRDEKDKDERVSKDVKEEESPEFSETGEDPMDMPKQDEESQSERPEVADKSTLIDEIVVKFQMVEEQNQHLKNEVANLTSKLSKIDLDKLIAQTNELKNVLNRKDQKISELEKELNNIRKQLKSKEFVQQGLEGELELLKERTAFMRQELDLKHDFIKEMQESLELERKGREFAIDLIKDLEGKLEEEKSRKEVGEAVLKLQKEEANVAKQEIYLYFSREVENLKGIIHVSKKLNRELQTENEILGEMKEYLEKIENKRLRNLITRLQAEVRVLKSFSKPEVEKDCEMLQHQVRELLKETDSLIDEIKELKSALESEKREKDFLEKEVINLQAELTACVASGNEVLGREMSEKEFLISSLREELATVRSDLENSANESQALKDRNRKLVEDANGLESEKKELKNEINLLQSREDELRKTIEELEQREKKSMEIAKDFESVSATLKDLKKEMTVGKESTDVLRERIRELEGIIKEKEETIKEREKTIKERDETIKEKEETFKEKEESIKEKEETIKEKEESIKEKEETIKEKEETIKEKEETIKEKEESIKQKEEGIKEKEEGIKEKEEEIKEKDRNLMVKEEYLKVKEKELESTTKASMDTVNEVNRLRSEIEILRSRLAEVETPEVGEAPEVGETQVPDMSTYERDLEEKYALEEALRKIENELDGLKFKLEECKHMEDEMATLRSKRDSLLEKMGVFESEIERLKKKLCDFESLKHELVQLKAEKTVTSEDLEVSRLYQELLEQKGQMAHLRKENDILKEELKKSENLLEVYKNLEKNLPENPVATTSEFYTPPALLSPHSSGLQEDQEEMITLESHKKEIKDLESHYEQKMRILRDSNAEKLKKLSEHHEKEAKYRTKAFYESINSIKSSYENDIKKLVEKHKVSIMRLQGLHEDEVQELNTAYETQMEAMQTQNENLINDLRTDSAEKFKQLREQHNRDIRDLARKYEELLREKDARIMEEKANVETSVKESTNDIKEVHKQAIESLTQYYQNTIVELEEKHSQEMKKCKKNNLKRIDLMKNKYEALLAEERKKYEEQLEEMLLRLRNGQENVGDNVAAAPEHFAQKNPTNNTQLEFHEVLQKILNEGLECLTFEELILVHGKTCFLPEDPMEGNAGGERYGQPCKHKELMAAEKEELLKRIFTLEHEIVIKQLETHEAIVNMEAAEICRVQELKNALCTAQQKNAELKRLLSDQSKQEMNLKIDRYMSDKQATFHETNVVEKVKELEKEKAERRRLEEELLKEKSNLKNMAAALEAEKERHQIQRKRDGEYVESIRQRLEEALNHEQMMESQLDYEMKLRGRLEAELQNFHKSFNFKSDLPSAPLEIETKSVKNLKNQDESGTRRGSRHDSRRRSRLKSVNN